MKPELTAIAEQLKAIRANETNDEVINMLGHLMSQLGVLDQKMKFVERVREGQIRPVSDGPIDIPEPPAMRDVPLDEGMFQ